jgi:hypothetical protein
MNPVRMTALALSVAVIGPPGAALRQSRAGPVRIQSAAAIAIDGTRFETLEDGRPFDSDSGGRVLLVGAIDDGGAERAVRDAVRWFDEDASARLRRSWSLSALPRASSRQASRLARWAVLQAPDLVIEIGAGGTPTWPDVLNAESARLGAVPVRTLAASRADIGSELGRVLATTRSGAGSLRTALSARASRDPLAIARLLAGRYPQQPSISYISALAWINSLALTRITHEAGWRDKVRDQLAPWLSGEKPLFGDQTPLTSIAGAMIFAEITDAERSAALMNQATPLAAALEPGGTYAHGRGWTDDMFMATAVLVRTPQIDLAARQLIDYAKRLQRADGLFNHAVDGPFAWGRGNGFAAFGLLEALAAMPAGHVSRPALLDIFRGQMTALVKLQAPDGMWNEVVDEPGSYRELTATAMIFTALARGIRFGWLDRSFISPADRAWRAIAAHVADDGSLLDVCESTGAGKTRQYYLERKALDGLDDRGGAMALMASVERHELSGGLRKTRKR